MIKINPNYFVINSTIDNAKYFLNRGHFFSLLWDRFKWYWFPRLNFIPRFPQTVDIETSLSCQLRCPMCTRSQMPPETLSGIMDFSLFRKIIDECSANRVFSVKLSWRGEPTLNPRLVDMVAYAKSKHIRDVAFLTNGGLIDERMTRKLIEAGLDWISFSIDGLYGKYEKIRKPIKFERILATVKRFHKIKQTEKRKKPLVRIQTISGLVAEQPEYFAFWEPWVDRISVIAEQHREDPDQIVHDPEYVCQAPFQRIFITYDGDVVPCHGDYFLHHRMGNVREKSIRTIWNFHGFRQFRKDMRKKKRLLYKGCQICPDGGKYRDDKLVLEGRTVPLIKYLEKGENEG